MWISTASSIDLEDIVLEVVECSPATDFLRMSDQVGASQMHLWRTLHDFGVYTFTLTCWSSTTNWLCRICRVLPLALGKPAASHENFIHWWDYIHQRWNDQYMEFTPGHLISLTHPENHIFRAIFWLTFVHCYWKPSNWAIFTWTLDIEALPHFLEVELPLLFEDVPLHIMQELWLQQDGASLPCGRQVTAFISQHFQNYWTGQQGLVAWPASSCDLTSLDYYHCGHTKSPVCAAKSSTS
jgi:hypothetical protein